MKTSPIVLILMLGLVVSAVRRSDDGEWRRNERNNGCGAGRPQIRCSTTCQFIRSPAFAVAVGTPREQTSMTPLFRGPPASRPPVPPLSLEGAERSGLVTRCLVPPPRVAHAAYKRPRQDDPRVRLLSVLTC